MPEHVLKEHFKKARKTLIEISNHLEIVNHKATTGFAREALIHEFLEKNLPSCVQFSSGEIRDINNTASGQIDIIIQSINDPKIPLHSGFQISLCDAVIATIEVKSNLTTGKPDGKNALVQSFKSFRKIKELKRIAFNKAEGEKTINKNEIPCILFAFKGPTYKQLSKSLKAYCDHHNINEENSKYLPDVIVILDKGYYLYKNDGWIWSMHDNINANSLLPHNDEDETLIGIFVYLFNLIQSWNNNNRNLDFVEYLKAK